jgi:hypothetical protein
VRSIDRRVLFVGIVCFFAIATPVIGATVLDSLTLPGDGTVSDDTRSGVKVDFDSDNFVAVRVTLDQSVEGAEELYLADSTGETIESKSVTSNTVKFDTPVKNGEYTILVGANGNAFTQWEPGNTNYPYESESGAITVTGGFQKFVGQGTGTEYRNVKTIELIKLNTSEPSLSNPQPSASETVNESPVQLNISVSDADFPTSQGDSVTVEFTNEDTGSTIGIDTLTSNGTATATFDSPQGGANNWSATATDSYGNTVSSQTFTFNAPSELEIRDEESPETLLTDANVTIEFYPQGADRSDVVTRPATDGTVDMTGLDVDSDFIAVAKADGYANRRIYVESLIETQEIYLLNESSDTVDIQFELEDFSGEYQQDSSVLIVEREINGQMTPVQGDFFGATGRWEATLKRDTRHRIRIKNLDSGKERTLGPFTPQTSGVQTVTVEPDGAVQLNPEFSQVSAQPALGVIPAEDQAIFGVEIEEGDEMINSYSIEVRHMDENGTATTLATRTGTGASVEEFTLNLTGLQGQVIANVDVETDSGTRSVVVSREIRESYPGADGLLGGLLEVGTGLGVGEESGASGASSMAAFFLSVLVTGAVARQTSASADLTGLTALGSLTAFAIIGWLSMQVLFAVAVAFAGALTLRRGI